MDGARLPRELDEALAQRLTALAADDFAARLWGADTSLWKPHDDVHQRLIAGALGWLEVFDDVRDQVEDLNDFVAGLRAEGFRSAVLLGMGGSSLAPEV